MANKDRLIPLATTLAAFAILKLFVPNTGNIFVSTFVVAIVGGLVGAGVASLQWLIIVALSASVANAAVKEFSTPHEELKIKITDQTVVVKKWFFIRKMTNNWDRMPKAAERFVVYTGEQFGIGISYARLKPNIKAHIELNVPEKPENFPCKKCKAGELTISADRKTVIVDTTIGNLKGESGWYWGIAAEDPRGQYKIKMSIENQEIAEYTFEVK